MPEQLSFDLPSVPAVGRDDFFVSSANETSVALIEHWHAWPANKLLLCGPAGSGKSHLAHVWAALSGAMIITADDLGGADVAALARHCVVIEDADRIAGIRTSEEALFHLHNLVLAEGHSLLITAQSSARSWGLILPDLASRVEATTSATLQEPDDALLSAVMMKLFADRQLLPTPEVIPYLTRRIPRSFTAAQQVVAQLDHAALTTKRPINRALAALVLDNLAI